MRTNLTIILSAIGVAALLASPVVAKTVRHHVNIPSDARRSVAPHGYGSFANAVNPPCHEFLGFCK
jgi:hypothetical protein